MCGVVVMFVGVHMIVFVVFVLLCWRCMRCV